MLVARSKSVVLAALVSMLLLASASFRVSAIDETDAKSAMAAAQDRIVVCYQAVADADKSDANVTALLAVLEGAGELLSKAYLAFNAGDFGSARDLAFQSQQKLDGFVAEANSLRKLVLQHHYSDFMVNVVGSIVATFVILAGGSVIWFLLNRKFGEAGSATA